MTIFRNRSEAGRLLAMKLGHCAGKENTLVLALPRGGVPVGYEIAQALQLPLDIFLVRKLGVPGHEELAFGAVASGHITFFNEEIIKITHLSPAVIETVLDRELQVLKERNDKYRGDRSPLTLNHYHIILVDDGVATGATLRVAVKALRQAGCRQITAAVPVAPLAEFESINSIVDEFICLETPADLNAIGYWYEDFSQTSDEEVIKLLISGEPFKNTR